MAGATPLFGAVNVQWAPKVFYPQPNTRREKTTLVELIDALLAHGADPNVRLKKDLWYTGYNGGGASLSAESATAFWRAAHAGDDQAMRALIAGGADPLIASAEGVTPLLACAGAGFSGTDEVIAPQGRMPAMRYMVEELKLDVNAVDTKGGHSAIHHAAHRGDNEMLLYLVSKGARVDIVAKNGQTTADMANGPRQRIQPFAETIALLQALGARNNNKCVSC
jgi:ankyrin repeat protein